MTSRQETVTLDIIKKQLSRNANQQTSVYSYNFTLNTQDGSLPHACVTNWKKKPKRNGHTVLQGRKD